MSAPTSTDTSDAPATEAAEAAAAAIAGSAGQEVSFSLALTQEQKDIRDWVHGFAADVIRPGAQEWDEKERHRGRSSRRPRRSASTASKDWPSSSPTRAD